MLTRRMAALGVFVLSVAMIACGERAFPLEAARTATSIRVLRLNLQGGRSEREITDRATLEKIVGIVGRYDSWQTVPECRSSNICRDVVIEWRFNAKTQLTMSMCEGDHRARVGDPGIASPCGRRVPDDAAAELVMALAK